MEEDDDEGREAKGGRTPRMGEEREDEHEGDPAWRRLSRRTSAGTLRRSYKKETSTAAHSGGWGRAWGDYGVHRTRRMEKKKM